MLAAAAETEIEVIPVTDRGALPLTPFSDALMVAEPAETAVARPAELMVASAVLEDFQVAVAVTFCVEPSLYVAVAVN